MKKILNLLFLLILIINGYSQNTEQLKIELEYLKNEKKVLGQKIIEISNSISVLEMKIEKEILQSINKGFICNIKTSAPIRLKSNPKPNGNVIEIIPKKKLITVLEYSGDSYWKISYKETVGYIHDVAIVQTDEMIIIKNEYVKKTKESKSQRQNESKTNRKEFLVKKYGVYQANNILKGKVVIGMTKEMVVEAIGNPDDKNISKGTWGVHEQWVYEKNDLYVYFENGKLTSIQE
ncbi:MAG: hypothetical protein GY834_15800 [Bacteroidetes bacterium]|nr:hypothetical protein [Bacteroidota bacterium]